uniref:Uncharacterized protein n=2 Tax=Amorphochlora amoebiformis TaxID=1561963 RepID=A0A7S0CY78_9EUKA
MYPETGREGQKFVVDQSMKITQPHVNFKPTEKDLKRLERIARREGKLREQEKPSSSQLTKSETTSVSKQQKVNNTSNQPADTAKTSNSASKRRKLSSQVTCSET